MSKASYVGAPAVFLLEMGCKEVAAAFGVDCCYLVGSSTTRADWRDVDIRLILPDAEFERWFPGVGGCWEQDPKWLLLVTAISAYLRERTGLPVDFQIQQQTHANKRHAGSRHAIGLQPIRRAEDGGR